MRILLMWIPRLNITTASVVRHGTVLALFALLVSPRDAAASPFSLSRATIGGATNTDFRLDELKSHADISAGPEYLASASTNLEFGPFTSYLTGRVKVATNGTDRFARAEASVDDSWTCPIGEGCLNLVLLAQMNAIVAFDGILDPLIASVIAGVDGTDESSLSVFFSYLFPDGMFSFRACYEAGDAFVRAELGCGTVLQAGFDRSNGTHIDLTNRLVLGVDATGAHTVAFNEILPWILHSNTWTIR